MTSNQGAMTNIHPRNWNTSYVQYRGLRENFSIFTWSSAINWSYSGLFFQVQFKCYLFRLSPVIVCGTWLINKVVIIIGNLYGKACLNIVWAQQIGCWEFFFHGYYIIECQVELTDVLHFLLSMPSTIQWCFLFYSMTSQIWLPKLKRHKTLVTFSNKYQTAQWKPIKPFEFSWSLDMLHIKWLPLYIPK